MRIGLLGGSFDPPHNGHLLAARDAQEALALDCVVFIPAAVQPLKAILRSVQDDPTGSHLARGDESVGSPPDTRDPASAEHRLAMVRLLVGDEPGMCVDAIEIDRGGLSYTVETLMSLKAKTPSAELFWLVGADIPETFAKWREPERIVELATVVVLQRSDQIPDLTGLPGPPCLLATRRFDVSSTEIRDRVRRGKSIRGFVPESVAHYIASEGLYR